MVDDRKGLPLIGDVSAGLYSPIQSLRFLLNNKFVMSIGLAPQVLGLVAYIWLAVHYLLPYVDRVVMDAVPASWNVGILGVIAQSFVTLLLIALYAVAFLPLVGALASPLYDIVAARAFEQRTGRQLPHQGLKAMMHSMGSEIVKLFVYYLLLAATLLIPALSPFFLVFSIWYLGWDLMDRTLTLMNLSLGQRATFGLRHALACLGLGIWAYIPLVGAALGFAFAAAGALSVARLTPDSRLTKLEPLSSKPKE
jgi:uncharacterized protein involved in cysteine biosynthesis